MNLPKSEGDSFIPKWVWCSDAISTEDRVCTEDYTKDFASKILP